MNEPATTRQPRIAGAGRKRRPFLIDQFLFRRGPLIALAGGLLFAVLLVLLLPWTSPTYETEGLLIVDPGKEPTLTGRERETIPGDLGDYTRTLVGRFTSFDVLLSAVESLNPTSYPAFFKPREEPARNAYRLIRRIKATEVARTHLIRVVMTGDEPDNLGPTLDAVMQAFIGKLNQEQENKNQRRLDYLVAERDQIIARIEKERQRMLAIAEGLENKAFLHEAYTVHLSKVEQIQRLYWEAAARAAEAEGELARAEANRRELGKLDLQPFADERVADNFGINRIEQWTYEQLQSMRAGIDGLTGDNPDRRYVEERMLAMNAYLGQYKSNVNVSTIRNLEAKRAFELESEVVKNRNAFEAARTTTADLSTKLDAAREEASKTSQAIFNASDITFTITQLRERLSALNNRIDDCQIEAKAPLRIAIDRHPVTPKRAARTNSKTLLMLALVLGFGGVTGLSLAFDFLDDRIRQLREVEAALGGPAADPIAAFVSGISSEPGPFNRLLLDQPGHQAAHALRDLGVRLNFERERHGARVFLVCGINPGAGASSIALHLGHALASACEHVLVVELNRRQPGLARVAELAEALPSIEDALETPAACRSAPRDALRGVHLLAATGREVRGGIQAGLLDLMREARAGYDVILIDVPPPAGDELSHFAALHADAAILVVQEDQSQYRHLRANIELLRQAGIPAMTAVLNQSRARPSGWQADLLQDRMKGLSRFHQVFLARVRAAGQQLRNFRKGGT